MKILLLIAALSLSACANTPTRFDVNVEALTQYPMKNPAKVFIEDNSKDKPVGLESLFYLSEVAAVFKQNGYEIVDDVMKSDYYISFANGTGRNEQQVSRPILNWQQPQSYSVNTYTPRGVYSSQIQQNGYGSLQVVGARTETIVTYFHTLAIFAFDSKRVKERPKDEQTKWIAWQASLSDANNISDKKLFFPVLTEALNRLLMKIEPGKYVENIEISNEGEIIPDIPRRMPANNNK